MGVDTLREEAAHVEMPTLHRRLEICISLELCLQLRLRTHLPSERAAADSREPTRARCTIIVRRARAASAHGQPHDTSTRGARVRRARECRGRASAAGAPPQGAARALPPAAGRRTTRLDCAVGRLPRAARRWPDT